MSHDPACTVTARERKGALPEADLSTVVARPLLAKHNASHDDSKQTYVAHRLSAEGFDASEDGTGRGTPIVPIAMQERMESLNPAAGLNGKGWRDDGAAFTQAIAFDTTQITSKTNRSNPRPGDPAPTLAKGGHPPALAFSCKDHGADADAETSPTLRAMGHDASHANAGGQVAVTYSIMPQNSSMDYKARAVDVAQPVMGAGPVGGNQGGDYVAERWAVRRLTPLECERLQGLPDGHTAIPWRGKPAEHCPDGPRYKAVGNAMAVNCMRWIGQRIALCDQILRGLKS